MVLTSAAAVVPAQYSFTKGDCIQYNDPEAEEWDQVELRKIVSVGKKRVQTEVFINGMWHNNSDLFINESKNYKKVGCPND